MTFSEIGICSSCGEVLNMDDFGKILEYLNRDTYTGQVMDYVNKALKAYPNTNSMATYLKRANECVYGAKELIGSAYQVSSKYSELYDISEKLRTMYNTAPFVENTSTDSISKFLNEFKAWYPNFTEFARLYNKELDRLFPEDKI